MKKRILSILLCLVMCLSLLPMVAFAEGEPVKITKVAVTGVPTPVVGASTAISASDVTITTDPADAATINEIYWNTIDETFQADKSYRLIVRFAPKTGYYFEFEDETDVEYYIGDVTFNGQPAFSAYESGSVPGELFATSQSMTPTAAPTPVKITKVAVTMPTTITVGEPTDTSGVTITTEPADSTNVYDIFWYNYTDSTDTDTSFKANCEYFLNVELTNKDGYYFEFDNSEQEYYLGQATVNGEEPEIAWSFGYDDLVIMSKHMKPVALEKITKVEIQVTEPVDGETPDTAAVVVTTPEGAATVFEDLAWGDEYGDPATVFEEGKTYYCYLSLAPKDGYEFEFEDGTGSTDYCGTALVNGACERRRSNLRRKP